MRWKPCAEVWLQSAVLRQDIYLGTTLHPGHRQEVNQNICRKDTTAEVEECEDQSRVSKEQINATRILLNINDYLSVSKVTSFSVQIKHRWRSSENTKEIRFESKQNSFPCVNSCMEMADHL